MDKTLPIIKIKSIDTNKNINSIERFIEDDYFSKLFNLQIISHIENDILGKLNDNILCYFVNEFGNIYDVSLQKENYHKSLLKVLEYFELNENYEICSEVQKLISKIKI